MHQLILSNQECKLENKWEKTKDWRGKKLQTLSDLFLDFYEVGKVTTKVEFVSEVEIKAHLKEDHQELI